MRILSWRPTHHTAQRGLTLPLGRWDLLTSPFTVPCVHSWQNFNGRSWVTKQRKSLRQMSQLQYLSSAALSLICVSPIVISRAAWLFLRAEHVPYCLHKSTLHCQTTFTSLFSPPQGGVNTGVSLQQTPIRSSFNIGHKPPLHLGPQGGLSAPNESHITAANLQTMLKAAKLQVMWACLHETTAIAE